MFKVEVDGKVFAVKFLRPDSWTTKCVLRCKHRGSSDLPVKNWMVIGVGSAKRHPKDKFDKGIGQVKAMERAMQSADLTRKVRQEIAIHHFQWILENGVKTILVDQARKVG